MVTSQQLQGKHLDSVKSHVTASEKAFLAVNPSQDQEMFVDHNIRPFTAPSDWGFEPCTTHYDKVWYAVLIHSLLTLV